MQATVDKMSLASQLYPFFSILYSKLYTCEGLIAILVILFPMIVLWIYQKRKSSILTHHYNKFFDLQLNYVYRYLYICNNF